MVWPWVLGSVQVVQATGLGEVVLCQLNADEGIGKRDIPAPPSGMYASLATIVVVNSRC